MAAVVEAPARDRDRLSLLRRTLDERRAELEEARQNIEQLVEKERTAVASSVREAPTRRVFAIGSAAQRIRSRRSKLEDSIPSLELEIGELEKLVVEEESARFLAQINEAVTAGNRLRKQELAAWAKAAETIVQLNETWSEVVENAEALEQLYVAITHSDAFKGCTDRDALEKFKTATRPAVAPFPHDLLGFTKRLLDVAEGVFKRNDRRSDHDGRLEEIVPKFEPRVPRLRGDRVARG